MACSVQAKVTLYSTFSLQEGSRDISSALEAFSTPTQTLFKKQVLSVYHMGYHAMDRLEGSACG